MIQSERVVTLVPMPKGETMTVSAQRNVPVFPDFPEEEYALRVHKLVEQMQLHDVDCVFLTRPDTVPYFTGHQTCSWDKP